MGAQAVSDKRVSKMTDEERRELAGAGRPVTYHEASSRYRLTEARERFEELAMRDALAWCIAALKARGEYDPARHVTEPVEPLTPVEHLEVLATGEVLARQYRQPAQVDHAVKAGATWEQIAEATGQTEAAARQQYRDWADGQHDLLSYKDGRFGMPDEYAAALERAAEQEQIEAGQ
jgi:hypothetical protein